MAAAATVGLVLAITAAGPGLARGLGDAIRAAIAAAAGGPASATTAAASAANLPNSLLGAALPLLGAAAALAALAHVAQTRAAWLPRRTVRGAPAIDGGPIPRTRRAAGELAAGLGLGAVAFGWLWRAAPRLAALPSLSPAGQLAAAAALLLALATALAVAWVALGALDAIARHAGLARALAMSSADKREDDRLAGADPRWQARRAQVARQVPLDEAIAGSSLLLLGDDIAVAIAWDPARRPIPTCTAAGRGPRAAQLLGLARRRRLPIHRDPALAAALLDVGPIPDRHWPRLAELVAAVRGRDRGRELRPAP